MILLLAIMTGLLPFPKTHFHRPGHYVFLIQVYEYILEKFCRTEGSYVLIILFLHPPLKAF